MESLLHPAGSIKNSGRPFPPDPPMTRGSRYGFCQPHDQVPPCGFGLVEILIGAVKNLVVGLSVLGISGHPGTDADSPDGLGVTALNVAVPDGTPHALGDHE